MTVSEHKALNDRPQGKQLKNGTITGKKWFGGSWLAQEAQTDHKRVIIFLWSWRVSKI